MLMRCFSAILCLAVLSAGCDSEKASIGSVVFRPGLNQEIDIAMGLTVEVVFSALNRSHAPVTLSVIGRSCTCLEVDAPPVLDPGQEHRIVVRAAGSATGLTEGGASVRVQHSDGSLADGVLSFSVFRNAEYTWEVAPATVQIGPELESVTLSVKCRAKSTPQGYPKLVNGGEVEIIESWERGEESADTYFCRVGVPVAAAENDLVGLVMASEDGSRVVRLECVMDK